MTLTHAVVEVVQAAAVDASRGLPSQFPVQFNPTQITLQRAAEYSETKEAGMPMPVLQFTTGKTATLSLELFFDTTEHGMGSDALDVRSLTRSFEQLVMVQPKTHAPPVVRLTWGPGLSFKGVANSVGQVFTLFASNGTPVRAQVSIAMQEYKTKEEIIAETNLQSVDHTRTLTVKQGDSLHAIAFREYGTVAHWRTIADANRDIIDNPRRLVPGALLVLPRLMAWQAGG